MLLLNADSRDVFYNVIRSYHDENIIIVTDPPFNVGYKYSTYNDNMAEDDKTLKKLKKAWKIKGN